MNKNKNLGAIIFAPAYYISKGLNWLDGKDKLARIIDIGCSIFFIFLFFTGRPYSSKWAVIATIMVLIPVYLLVIGLLSSVIPLLLNLMQWILSPFVTLYNQFTEDLQPSEAKLKKVTRKKDRVSLKKQHMNKKSLNQLMDEAYITLNWIHKK